MAHNNSFEKLVYAYESGSLIVHNAVAIEIEPERSGLIYQTITSAFMFPTSGEARIQLDQEVFHAKPGKLIYIPYTANIKISVLSEEKYSYINLFHQFPQRPLFEMDLSKDFDEVYELLTGLVASCKSAKTKKLFQKNIQIKKLFALLQAQTTSPQMDDYKVVKDLITYIDAHYHQDITLDKLASIANMKKSQISYLFKKYTNKRPIDYLIQHRIRKALELLETTDLLICEVAGEVGYQDPFYFSRLFKKYTGISPTTLRSQMKI